MSSFILSLDQGTSSCRTLAFNRQGKILAQAQKALPLQFPQPGWVEQDAEQLFKYQLQTAVQVFKNLNGHKCAGIAIANQRETVVAWDRITGKALAPAIVWQDRRTTHFCKSLKNDAAEILQKTGLVIDPYFSASKMTWLLHHAPEVIQARRAGRLCLGTIDAWLVFKLTEGKSFSTDSTNACRTQLYGIQEGLWDLDLLERFGLTEDLLPEIHANNKIRGHIAGGALKGLPILTTLGDQQASLFGHATLTRGQGKATFGTGCFALSYQGTKVKAPYEGLLTSVAFELDRTPHFCWEGSVLVAGSALQFLRDNLGMLKTSAESETLARSVKHTGGVVFVPALAGLGAPQWDAQARGTLVGLDRGTTKAHIARATLEGVAFQARELIDLLGFGGSAMLDGGMSANGFFCEFLASLLQKPVHRAVDAEQTARGAFGMAGITLDWWDLSAWKRKRPDYEKIEPTLSRQECREKIKRWQSAVERSRGWAE